jgi:hypothetical protein
MLRTVSLRAPMALSNSVGPYSDPNSNPAGIERGTNVPPPHVVGTKYFQSAKTLLVVT